MLCLFILSVANRVIFVDFLLTVDESVLFCPSIIILVSFFSFFLLVGPPCFSKPVSCANPLSYLGEIFYIIS